MSETQEQTLTAKMEGENRLHFDVLTVNERLETVEEFQEYARTLKTEGGGLQTILVPEFSLNISEVINKIEELKMLASELGIDIIAAPGYRHRGETKYVAWGILKNQLASVGVTVEESTIPDDSVPDSVGIFVGANGSTFAFPKNFGNLETGNCVHHIPGTTIGVSICGEINHINPEGLEEIKVLYNPSEEYDDPLVWIRMAQEAKGELLTRSEVEALLLRDSAMGEYIMSDEEYARCCQEKNQSLREQIGESKFDELFGDDPLVGEDETIEKRRARFDQIIDELLKELQHSEYDSMYVQNAPGLADALREKRIPVIRADGMKTSGILNHFDGMKIESVDSAPKGTRISLSL